MGQKEKLIMRIKNIPKDFTLAEAETLLCTLAIMCITKAKPAAPVCVSIVPEGLS